MATVLRVLFRGCYTCPTVTGNEAEMLDVVCLCALLHLGRQCIVKFLIEHIESSKVDSGSEADLSIDRRGKVQWGP